MQARLIGFISGLAIAAFFTGCSNGPPPGPPVAKAYQVRGQIKFADGAALRGGIIYFTPEEIQAGRKLRYEGAGLVDAEGKYKIGLNGDESGVPAGAYKVTILPRDYQELPNSNSTRIPGAYHDKKNTPLTITVNENDNVFNFEVK